MRLPAVRFAPVFLFVLLSLPLAGQQEVLIGGWNIEHLGNRGSRSGVGRNVAQTPEDLADYIRASGVHILALSEISANASSQTNRTINRALQRIREQTGDLWLHILFPKPGGSREQRVGVAWNTSRVRRVGNVFRIPVPNVADIPGPDDSIWARHPHAVKFSLGNGRTDLVVIALHMKANTDPAPLPVRKREAEARTLVDKLPAVRANQRDLDIVLIGDTNFLRASEAGAQLFRGAGFRDLNAQDRRTHFGGAPFDRAYVPDTQQEFSGSRQGVFDDEFMQPRNLSDLEFRRRFSDHFMIVTAVRVMDDDDN